LEVTQIAKNTRAYDSKELITAVKITIQHQCLKAFFFVSDKEAK
jgi:hypothetical protein